MNTLNASDGKLLFYVTFRLSKEGMLPYSFELLHLYIAFKSSTFPQSERPGDATGRYAMKNMPAKITIKTFRPKSIHQEPNLVRISFKLHQLLILTCFAWRLLHFGIKKLVFMILTIQNIQQKQVRYNINIF